MLLHFLIKNRIRHLKLAVLFIIIWALFSYFWLYFYLAKSMPDDIYNPISREKLIHLVRNNVPNLPERYFRNPDNLKFVDDHDPCEKYPSLDDLVFNNDFWQEFHSEDGELYLYAAYYDDRPLTVESEHLNNNNGSNQAFVRILGLFDLKKVGKDYYCQLWFMDTHDHALVKTSSVHRLSRESDDKDVLPDSLRPYMISCPIPEQYKHMIPVSVSLLEQPCQDLTNNVQILSSEPVTRDGNKADICVCLLGLNEKEIPNFFNRFIEWMEMLVILGVDKVVLYEQNISSDIYPLLNYYIRNDILELVELKMPKANGKITHVDHVNSLSYNDCLYKSIYSYSYITALGINEMFIPKRSLTKLKDIINLINADFRLSKNQEPATYIFRSAYFTDTMQSPHGKNHNISHYLSMQQNVHRSTLYIPEDVYVGSIHNTKSVTTVGVRENAKCIDGDCSSGHVDSREGLFHCYQKDLTDCVGENSHSCAKYGENTALDTDIYKYHAEVDTSFQEAITFLNFTV